MPLFTVAAMGAVSLAGLFYGPAVSSIPDNLMTWLDKDPEAWLEFDNALVCHRPAWLYHKLRSDTSVNGLIKEIYQGSDIQFWLEWLFAPQVIGMRIIFKHFTAHTWWNWIYVITELLDFIYMLLDSKTHLAAMPLRCLAFLLFWGQRQLLLSLFSLPTAIFLIKLSMYSRIAGLAMWIRLDTEMLWSKFVSN
jgi:hypothetical protein